LNQIEKDNILLENYSYEIGKTHKRFLLSNDLRGLSSRKERKLNPTDIRNSIMKNLGSSMWYIHTVLKNSKNLHQNEINEIFNAVNLESFFDSLLKDKKNNTTLETGKQVPKKI